MSENGSEAPAVLPNKKYFSIGEVSNLCQVKDHVLRYWEKEIPELNPRRRKGRRYYQREDVFLIREIQGLMREGYTLEGARLKLQGQPSVPQDTAQTQAVRQAVAELEKVVEMLKE